MTAGSVDVDKFISELDALLGPGPAPPPPAEAPPPAGGQAAAPAAEGAPRGGRILVADDNDDYRNIVKFLLEENGYDVLAAKSGTEGLRLARSHALDLALLDFDMPGLNGYELIQELRSREETRKLPIIMLTGAAHRAHLKSLGMDISRFIEKPISNQDLVAAVGRVLNGLPRVSGDGGPAAPEAPAEAGAPAPEVPAAAAEAGLLGELEEEAAEAAEELLIEEQKKEREEEELAGLDVLANESPIVNRINKILIRAVDMGASDIHIEPQEKHILVRVRHNGTLRLLTQLPSALSPQVAARVKIMANLSITERRRPQDGQVRAMIKGQKVEFRVSTIPSIHGEKIVMRILGGAKLKADVKELGFNARDLEVVNRALQSPHGIILVTGPTGSGKSTTLYTMIRQLNAPDVNIMTAEDPVEYELAGITQVAARPQIGVTFESILRSFLRQDPDIMLVGEIRDLETAEIAIKAAITGHLVFSTLHTNSAAATIQRLTNMGVQSYLVADSAKLIVAQRLIRTLCPSCRKQAPPPPELTSIITPEELARVKEVWEAGACAACGQTGYKGRKAIFEVMEVRSREIRAMILTSQSADQISQQAIKEGMTTLKQAAFECVLAGETSVSEALSVMLSD